MFNFSNAAIPVIPTRKALMIIDLQNDFISSDAALAVFEPDGFVSRTLELVKAFRNSGVGPVIWVRSEFERHRPLSADGDQIITSHLPPQTPRAANRGRPPTSRDHDGAAMEMDDEAFLSVSQAKANLNCVRKGTTGAEFPAQVKEAIDESRDIVFTKTHYSAFSSAQQHLVQLLRGRFVTDMYVCGSLTNIGIYATALDAGRHGYDMTIVEDCCGFRSEMRHVNAVRRLMQLIGSEVLNADKVIEQLQPPKPKAAPRMSSKSSTDQTGRVSTGSGPLRGPGSVPGRGGAGAGAGAGGSGNGVGTSQKTPVRPQPAAPQLEPQASSTGLSPSLSKVSLGISQDAHDSSSAAPSAPQPAKEHVPPTSKAADQGQNLQGQSAREAREVPAVVKSPSPAAETRKDSTNPQPADTSKPSFWVGTSSPLEADSDYENEPSSPETAGQDTVEGESRHWGAAGAEMRSWMTSGHVTPRSPPRQPHSPHIQRTPTRSLSGSGANANALEKTRIAARPRQRQRSNPVDSRSSSPAKPASPENKDKTTAQSSSLPSSKPRIARKDPSHTTPIPSRPKQARPIIPTPSPKTAKATNMADKTQDDTAPIFSDSICEGDTTIITNALSPALAADAFERLLKEVSWAGMSRMGGEVPRRIAVQGAVDEEGNMPVYRHPADESPPLLPFSPTVLAIKTEIEQHLGHPLNHVLIQHYRSGNDYISEHSDKTLDIARGSYIANVSLGAERTMVLRTKRPHVSKDTKSGSDDDNTNPQEKQALPPRKIARAPLPHNSLLRMGLQTNMRWLHAIRPDKRADRDKSSPELSYSGARISLTFRQIGTFLSADQSQIWGQGAVAKTRPAARPVINGQTPEAVALLKAFGIENHASEFNWAEHYGGGFDVLHLGQAKRVCFGRDEVRNMRVRLALAELGVGYAKGSVDGDQEADGGLGVRFEDNDPGRATMDGDGGVLRYLDAVYGVGRRYDQLPPAEVARRFGRLEGALGLLGVWRKALRDMKGEEGERGGAEKMTRGERLHKLSRVKELKNALTEWEGFAKEAAAMAAAGSKSPTPPVSSSSSDPTAFYVAGTDQPSPADFALWPVLHDVVHVCGEDVFESNVLFKKEASPSSKARDDEGDGRGYLARYYRGFRARSAVAKVLGG